MIMLSLLCGCASTYKGPKTGDILDMCRAEVGVVWKISECFDNKFSSYMPNWRDDKDSWVVRSFLDYINAQGNAVKEGRYTDAEAWRNILAYNNRKTAEAKERIANERAASAQRSAAALTGAAILLTSPAAYPESAPQAPLIPYPSDTTINAHPVAPYRFYDSRPYN